MTGKKIIKIDRHGQNWFHILVGLMEKCSYNGMGYIGIPGVQLPVVEKNNNKM